jgi:aminoglycoside 3-N-acetyltransferase
MSEADAIGQVQVPATVDSLCRDLASLGVEQGMTLIVHSSLSSIGWVCGGAVGVVLAVEQALTDAGTLVMPTHSGNLSDPAKWENPPVPQDWWQIIRDDMPAYDPVMTPVSGIGSVAEVFRKQAGVTRSLHPHHSFAAWGRESVYVTGGDKLDLSMDRDSPLGRIYELDGYVLLLGVGHGSNTSLHLAEYLADWDGKSYVDCFAPLNLDGAREWTCYRDIDLDADDFIAIGAEFEKNGAVRTGEVGKATARLMRQRELVDFGMLWMQEYRGAR